jgi:hypothetical protein
MGMTIGAGGGPTRSKAVALVIPCIDWLALSRQKRALLDLIENDPDNVLWGVIHLLDEVQDQAEEAGYDVVWHAGNPGGKP